MNSCGDWGGRVEGAWLHAAGDQEVARALGRRAGQDRRLDLQEALAVHEPPNRLRDLVSKLDRVLHPLAAQVEVAVAKPHLLPNLSREALDLERRRLGIRHQRRLANANLELAGRQLGIDGLGSPAYHLAGDADDVLGPQPVA